MQLTKNFSLNELVFSKTAKAHGLINIPNEEQVRCLKLLAEKVLQPTRDALDMPLNIRSGFRSRQLNAIVKGSTTSQHVKGQAVDIVCKNNLVLFEWIKDNLAFDQLINEKPVNGYPSWVHVSFNPVKNRGEVLVYNGHNYKPYNENLE